MRSHPRRGALMAGCLVVFVAACGEALPRPDHITAPETVGVVTSFDEIECGLGRFHLDTGATVEVRDPDCQGVTDTREMFTGASGSPRPQPGELWENGPLLLFGSDDEGAWYAMAGGGEGCYQVYGDNAYLEGDFLQFSSGLRLPVAAAFEMNRDRTETFLFHSSDTICLDRTGTAVSAFVTWGI